MDKFITHTGLAVPLVKVNVDTDQIMPKQFLKRIERSGFGEFVFYDWRFNSDGMAKPDFVFNQTRYQDASILIAGKNFGCGSSREHAPWGLLDYGFKVIVAESFADIFYNNCFKTGILPVRVPGEKIAELAMSCESNEGYTIKVDLDSQLLSDENGFEYAFSIDPFRKQCLQQGLDDIGLTVQHENDISRYEQEKVITAS